MDEAREVTPAARAAIAPVEPEVDLRVLAARAVEGDARATEQLLVDVRRLVHRYARSRLGRYRGAEDAADDAAQEVCIAVLSALPRYRDQGVPFEAFVYGIASRKVADVQRAAMRRPQPTDEVPDGVDPRPGPEDLAVLASDADRARALLGPAARGPARDPHAARRGRAGRPRRPLGRSA